MANPYKKYTRKWWAYYRKHFTLHYWKYHYRQMRDWLPVIWNNFEGDQVWIYELLHMKFKRLRHHATHHACIANWDEQAHDYMVAETLLSRLLKDEYGDYEKWRTQTDAQRRRAFKHEEYMRQQDIDYLFRLMAKRIQIWWD